LSDPFFDHPILNGPYDYPRRHWELAEQFRVNGTICIKTMIQNLPQLWVNDFEFARLAPGQKKNFKAIVEGWQLMIERNIAGRLGEDKHTEAA
jgi:hypothetical protein